VTNSTNESGKGMVQGSMENLDLNHFFAAKAAATFNYLEVIR